MLHWFRLILMIFYAPARAMREVRDRGSLAPTALVALLTHALFFFALSWFYLRHLINPGRPLAIGFVLFQAAGSLVIIAIVFCPLTLFLANIFERRASFRLLLQQEYAALAATMFYALTAASLITTLLTMAGRFSGVQQAIGTRMLAVVMAQRSQLTPEVLAAIQQGILGPELISAGLSVMALAGIFAVWAILALRVVFRLSWIRSLIVVLISGTLLLPAYKLIPILGTILASPFLLLMLFLLLRG